MLRCSCFAFLCSCVNQRMCGGWGCNSSHTRCVFMDRSGEPGQLATAPLHVPPLITHAGCTSIQVGSRFEVKLVPHPQSPPSTSTLSTCHNCVISSQEREFSIPILLPSAFPSSCIKFALPRSCIPKIPGPRERGTQVRETRNAHPSLDDSCHGNRQLLQGDLQLAILQVQCAEDGAAFKLAQEVSQVGHWVLVGSSGEVEAAEVATGPPSAILLLHQGEGCSNGWMIAAQ